MLVFHADQEYLDDARGLQRYIESELNVRTVVFTSDEQAAGVRYRAVADWATLGKKLRKDIARVKKALPDLPSEDVRAYVQSGKIVVDGIELVEGDLTVQRYIDLPDPVEGQALYATHTDNDVVIRLDIQVHAELQNEWLTRELINRIQKMRKRAGLQATDDVDVFYAFEDGTGAELLEAMREYADTIHKTVRSVPVEVAKRKPAQDVLIEEEQEVADIKFVLSLAWPSKY